MLIISIGFKETIKTICKFPPIFLTPIFSIWTIGPVMSARSCCRCKCCCNSYQKLGVSIFLTWINLLITFVVSGLAYQIWFDEGAFVWDPVHIFPYFLLCFCPCFVFTMIFLILLQCLDKCPGCCCPCLPCCDTYCYPVTEFTYLDVNDLDALITQDDIEMAPLKM